MKKKLDKSDIHDIMILSKINDSTQFNNEIENIVKTKSMSYLDALLYYGDENKLESETIATMLNSRIKAKLRTEAEDLHFFTITAKLPI